MTFDNVKTKPKILIGVLSPLVLLLILGGVAVFSINSMLKSSKWVDHTYEVLADSATIVASAVDMETGMRGYLLAGKEEFLDPYKGGEGATYKQIDALKQTVSDNPKQVARLSEVEKILKDWQANVTEPTIGLRRDIGDAKTMNDMAKLIGEAHGKAYFDKFRRQIATFVAREETLMQARHQAFVEAQLDLSQLAKNNAPTRQILEKLEVMRANEEWVSHTHKVMARANEILAAAVDMETGMRGYLLAGKEEFLEPYNSGKIKFFQLVGDLQETVSDNPPQVQLLDQINENVTAWMTNVTEENIDLRRQIGDAKTMDDMADLVGEARGKVYFDQFRALMADFQAEEASLMQVRKDDNAAMVSFAYTAITICIIVALAIGLVMAFAIGRAIANPVSQMTDSMRLLADGDTSVHIPGTGRKDEIGDMAKAVMVFKENKIKADELTQAQRLEEQQKEQERVRLQGLIKEFERKILVVLDNLTSADRTMKTAAQEVKETSESTRTESETVASSATQASANVQTVATSAEELSSSISEIGRQVIQSTDVSDKAVSEAGETSEKIKILEENVRRISEVVALINDIADQTNLLALNATIEAARAGDAGKGFAVVASEVKNLANQTAKATEEIRTQINEVQNSTQGAVDAIDTISGVIGQISEISSSISAAVEEQGAATSEIARNVEEAATGTESVSSSITDVLHAAERSDTSANDILDATQALSEQTGILRNEVSTFLREVQNGDESDEIISWDESFSVGNDQVDREHQELLHYINTIYRKVKNGEAISPSEFAEIKNAYSLHFAGEETFMEDIGYDAMDGHVSGHQTMLAHLAELEKDLVKGDNAHAMDLLSLLSADWQTHTEAEDRKLAHFVRNLDSHKAAE